MTTGTKMLNEDPNITYAAITFDNNNDMDILLVPSTSADFEKNFETILNGMSEATAVYAIGVHKYGEFGQMNLTIAADKNKPVTNGYCLPEWVNLIRFDGDTPNQEDLGAVSLKIMSTLKKVS
ncbi:MAG: hypothetical protein MUO26_06490 [Methanotrichaceae archaeon]|nr:hypothetical protein [Methanotrichaceae archaeon]